MDNKQKAGVIFSAIVGLLQAVGLFVSVANEWTKWLTGHEAVILGMASAAFGVIQPFLHKVPVKPAAIAAGLFTVLALTFSGCARVNEWLKNVPSLSAQTNTGGFSYDPTNGTTVWIAPGTGTTISAAPTPSTKRYFPVPQAEK